MEYVIEMIKDRALGFETQLKSFYHWTTVVKNAWKNTCWCMWNLQFFINFPEKCYFQFFVLLTTKNTLKFFFLLDICIVVITFKRKNPSTITFLTLWTLFIPLWEGSLLFTILFPDINGTDFINLGRMKGWVNLRATQWFWTQDPWIRNPAP